MKDSRSGRRRRASSRHSHPSVPGTHTGSPETPFAAQDPNGQIRTLLSGQKILVIGGQPREQALRRLQHELALRSVVHCATRQADASARSFAAQLCAPDILLVIWVRGLSRTNHGNVVHEQCRSLEIPWIDCARIPHPRALVAAIERLRLIPALQRRRERIDTIGQHPLGGAA